MHRDKHNSFIPSLGFILAVGLWLCNFGYAQSADYWRYWTAEDGLSESWCNHLTVSPTGRLWISHGEAVEYSSGLEGYSVRLIPYPCPYNPIYEFSPGILWSLVDNPPASLLRLVLSSNPLHWETIAKINTDIRSFPFYVLENNTAVYLSGINLMALNLQSGISTSLLDSQSTHLERFFDMVKDGTDSFWISGRRGLSRIQIDPEENTTAVLCEERLFDPEFQSREFNQISISPDGRILGTASTLDRQYLKEWNGSAWETPFAAELTSDLIGWRSKPDTLWIYSNNKGLFRLAQGREFASPGDRVLNGQVTDFVVEKPGVFWIATSSGVARHAEYLWQSPQEISETSPEKIVCHSMIEDSQKRLWFACIDRLLCLEGETWKTYMFPEGFKTLYFRTYTLALLPNGHLTVYSQPDVLDFNPEQGSFTRVPISHDSRFYLTKSLRSDDVAFVAIDIDKRHFIIDAYNGERMVSLQDYSITESDPDIFARGTSMRDIIPVEKDRYFISMLAGIMEFRSGALRKIGPVSSSYCSLRRSESTFWFGSTDRILEYNGREWKTINEDVDHVYSMIETKDGSVWVAAMNGVFRWVQGSWIHHAMEEGLPNACFYTLLQDSRNRLWVGSGNGIYQYHPNADREPPDTLLYPEQNVNVVSTVGKTQILFSGIDKWKYTPSDQLTFSHRLDGGSWSPYTAGTIVLATGMASGQHRFEVRAMDSAGNIDDSPAQFSFIVQKPWYDQPILMILLVLGVSSLFFVSDRLVQIHRKLRRLAITDELTGLNNRRRFIECMNGELSRARRYEKNISLLMIDADRFKSINDRFGHAAGDQVLQTLAQVIRNQIRGVDIAGRMGGEEFVVLLPETNLFDACKLADRIRAAVENTPFLFENIPIPLTISIGAASCCEGIPPEKDLLQMADEAMYLAKQNGRNRVECFE